VYKYLPSKDIAKSNILILKNTLYVWNAEVFTVPKDSPLISQ
jgi:hypothetical protein